MKTFFLVTAVLMNYSAFNQALIDSHQHEIVYTSVNVVPMNSEVILENQTVVVREGKITAIGKNLKYSKDASVINGKGKYLMPGLAEMHAHIPPIDDLEPMKGILFLFAANGITTIRGMLGHPRHLELRTKIRQGEIFGPRFYTTGPSLNGISIKTAERGRELVQQQKEAGYDFLKLHPGLTNETFDAIASTAHEVNIPFAGHVSFGVGVWRAIEAGYSSIDHMDGFIEALVPGVEKMVEQQTGPFGMQIAQDADTSRIPRLMAALKEKNIWVVPTQSLAERSYAPNFTGDNFLQEPESKYIKKELAKQWVDGKASRLASEDYDPQEAIAFIKLRRYLIFECQRNGVGLLLGCDAPQVFNVPGFSTHNELKFLVDAGLTPYQALKTGTTNVAEYLGLADAGVVRVGAIADLILLNGNPLKDINNTKLIEGVMVNGKWLSKSEISNGLKKLEN